MKELEKDLNGQYSPENYYKCSCWYKCQQKWQIHLVGSKTRKPSIQITRGSKISKLNANASSKLTAYILMKKYTDFLQLLLYNLVNTISNVEQNDK